MVEYIKAVAVKAFGVFAVTMLGAVTADNALGIGVDSLANAAEVSVAAALATVVWPAASKLAAKAASTSVPDIPA